MPTLVGRRYGEPDWKLWDPLNTSFHPDHHPALLLSSSSYEEQRLAKLSLDSGSAMAQMHKKLTEPTLVDLADKTDVIKVVVGHDQKTSWVVHEALFTAASAFAKAALSHPFAENEQRTITLPEEDPAVFAIFVKWLYTGAVRSGSMDKTLALYVLADRLQVPVLCKLVFEGLSFRHDQLRAEQIQYVLDNTAAPDPLRYVCMQRLIREIQARSRFLDGPLAADLCHNHASEILAIMMGKFQELIVTPVDDSETQVTSQLQPCSDATKANDPFNPSALLLDLPKLEASTEGSAAFASPKVGLFPATQDQEPQQSVGPPQSSPFTFTYPQPLQVPAWGSRSEPTLTQPGSSLSTTSTRLHSPRVRLPPPQSPLP